MRLFRSIALAVTAAVFLALPSFAAGSTPAYVGYIACGWKTSAAPATSCSKSHRIGAFFKSNDATVKWRTCVIFPNGEHRCSGISTAQQGLYYVNHLTVGTKGTLKVRWRVGGHVVARYSITVTR